LNESLKDLRDFMFRGLTFEAEAERFRAAGIRVGADQAEAEASLLESALVPFEIDVRNEALQMARLYSVLYCFENAVRRLVSERLQESQGVDWWNNSVPRKVREFAEERQADAQKDSWLEAQNKDPMQFLNFGHLADIIIARWEDFADLVTSQHWLKQRMEELEKARNFIAHNRLLLPAEFQRIYMYVADWNRMVGL
jgi:hypothetical protein